MIHSGNKLLLLSLILFVGLSKSTSAQTLIPASDASKYIGKVVRFFEMAYTVKYSTSSKTCLVTFPYPGTRDNSPVITIVFHNVNSAKRIHWLRSLQGRWINLTGRLLVNKGDFIINGDDPHTRLNVYTGMIEVPELPPTPGPIPRDPDQQSPDTTHHKLK